MLCALAFDVAPNAVEAATATAAMSRAAATMRFLIENIQRASLDGLVRRDSPRWREERTCLRPSIGLYHSATARETCTSGPRMSRPLCGQLVTIGESADSFFALMQGKIGMMRMPHRLSG